MPTPKPHLLAIGITTYDPDSGLAPTPYAEEDAAEIAAEFAQRCGFQTTTLLGKNATRQNIERAILALSKQSGPTFAFGFFGHGQYINGHYMLHPYDSTVAGIGGLSFELLSRQWQHDFGFDQVIAILDACRNELGSDSLSRGSAPAHSEQASRDLEQVVNTGARRIEILYGCRQGQRCWGYHELKHGLLSAALLDILRTHPKDQDLDFRSLADLAADWMEDSEVRRKYGDARRQAAYLYGQPTRKRRIILRKALTPSRPAATTPPYSNPVPPPPPAPKSSPNIPAQPQTETDLIKRLTAYKNHPPSNQPPAIAKPAPDLPTTSSALREQYYPSKPAVPPAPPKSPAQPDRPAKPFSLPEKLAAIAVLSILAGFCGLAMGTWPFLDFLFLPTYGFFLGISPAVLYEFAIFQKSPTAKPPQHALYFIGLTGIPIGLITAFFTWRDSFTTNHNFLYAAAATLPIAAVLTLFDSLPTRPHLPTNRK